MAQSIHQVHDKFFKRSLKEKRIAIDFLRAHLPTPLYQRLNTETLALTDKSLVLPKLREIHSDIVYQCQIDLEESYILFLIEHLSSAPELMAFRKLQYTVGLMDAHLSEGHAKLPLVLPICLYHGSQSPYPHPTDIFDEFSHPELAREIVFKPFQLINLTTLSEETIEKHGLAALMQMLLKHYRAKDFVNKIKQIARSGLFAQTIGQIGHAYLDDVLHYVFYSNQEEHTPSAKTLSQVLAEAIPNQREVIMSLGEALEKKGWQRGIQEGQQEGQREKALSIAQNMLVEGFSLAVIKRVSGLSDEEIEGLTQKH